ncbi:hypothetical protein D3Z47_22790 [Lachnospiraceae bacterium]|nr:hypothetical protein [Lachnospiraceae bacterium]
MKLMNFDTRTLIYENVRANVQKAEKKQQTYTKAQYDILCRLIVQKKITEQFFSFILSSLFELKDWKQLSYEQMYELIHVLTFWDYRKERRKA